MYKNKKIIYIYGASGAGSTTLGNLYVKINRGELIDTDTYYLRNDNFEDRYKDMLHDIVNSKEDIIVITGSFWNWKVDFDELAKNIDIFVRVMLDKEERLKRLRKRAEERHGDRIKEGNDMYEEYIHGIEWSSKFEDGDLNVRSLATCKFYEQKYNKTPIIIDSMNSVEDNVKLIK